MRGRKPKPSALKKLDGDPGKRGIDADEPKAPPGLPPCPEDLPPEAKLEWERVCHELKPLKILTRLDRAALAAYCTAWARWRDAEANLTKVGAIVKSPSGYPIQNPYLAVANQALNQMHRFLVELGMTPSARSRVRVAESPVDELLEYIHNPNKT